MEKDYENKLQIFVDAIIKHEVDIVALQEIMQPVDGVASKRAHINCGKIPLKIGNHALNIVNELSKRGVKYNFAWLGFKRSYDKFDEGLAILTPHEITEIKVLTLTPFDDYYNWKTRKAIGVKVFGQWFYSVHLGWWDSFKEEFERLSAAISGNDLAWLMGDFNSIADERDKGYDFVVSNGWYDTYLLAVSKDGGITASKGIDGWDGENAEIRIDYIFSNKRTVIESSLVIFNGKNEQVISDHYGIIITTRKEEK